MSTHRGKQWHRERWMEMKTRAAGVVIDWSFYRDRFEITSTRPFAASESRLYRYISRIPAISPCVVAFQNSVKLEWIFFGEFRWVLCISIEIFVYASATISRFQVKLNYFINHVWCWMTHDWNYCNLNCSESFMFEKVILGRMEYNWLFKVRKKVIFSMLYVIEDSWHLVQVSIDLKVEDVFVQCCLEDVSLCIEVL